MPRIQDFTPECSSPTLAFVLAEEYCEQQGDLHIPVPTVRVIGLSLHQSGNALPMASIVRAGSLPNPCFPETRLSSGRAPGDPRHNRVLL